MLIRPQASNLQQFYATTMKCVLSKIYLLTDKLQ